MRSAGKVNAGVSGSGLVTERTAAPAKGERYPSHERRCQYGAIPS